jgi:succinylglutamic semialdehyde dehydrogenase
MANYLSIFTNGKWKKGSGPIFTSHNPANNEVVWEAPSALPSEVDEVMRNAKAAFSGWAKLTTDERLEYLNRYGDILNAEKSNLAEAISKETGKPLWDSKSEVDAMILKIGISVEAYGRRCAGMMRNHNSLRSVTRHKPHGVVGIMGPFNFPGHLPNGHIIPALLAGNTVVFKPSELTPLVAELMIKYWEKANLPKGVINLIQGGHETGKALVEHPHLNGLFFTGSYKTGRWLSEIFGKQPQKILALEMGGNNPLVVSHISDPDLAAFLTIQSAYLSAGQRCTCARRLIVVKNEKGEQFINSLIQMTQKIVVGAYTDIPEPYMGPVITEKQALNLLEAQDHLAAMGAKVLVEMQHLSPKTGFLSPGLIDTTFVAKKPDEEFFGPLLQLIWVQNLKEAIQEANQTKFGLTAGLLSDRQEEYDEFYRTVKAGLINWNTQLTGASSSAPFGGVECSGNYRPSAYYAADYCSYPVASQETPHMHAPSVLPPGLKITF